MAWRAGFERLAVMIGGFHPLSQLRELELRSPRRLKVPPPFEQRSRLQTPLRQPSFDVS